MDRRVVLAMSGGVDSSVAAHLLVQQGYQVIGVFMRHASAPLPAPPEAGQGLLPVLAPHGARQGCCTVADALDARRVADELGIPFYALDFQPGFDRIMDYFVDQYASGRTPNPCIVCNNWLKFGRLFDYADGVGARYVATGHYARLVRAQGGSWELHRGRDARKDQSYVLFGIGRERLERMLLPVGDFEKGEIRRRAAAWKVRVADKPDSQEICFVERGRHADFVAARRGNSEASGELVTTDGRVVGRHGGIEAFTVGQRRGLGVALGEPYYVVRIEASTRRVVLGRKEELACGGLVASRCNWLVDVPGERFACQVQLRYQSRPVPARVAVSDAQIAVHFDRPVLGVAPGQAVVCYDGSRVLGGGWIDGATPVAA